MSKRTTIVMMNRLKFILLNKKTCKESLIYTDIYISVSSTKVTSKTLYSAYSLMLRNGA